MAGQGKREGLSRPTRLIVAALLVGNLTVIIVIGWRTESGGGPVVLVLSLLFIAYVAIDFAIIDRITGGSRSSESRTGENGRDRKSRSTRRTRRP